MLHTSPNSGSMPSTISLSKRDPATLRPYERNARNHPREQLDALKAIIQRVGFIKPITVDEDGVILAGHGAHQVALELALANVPVITAKGLSATEKKAWRVADNRVAALSEWLVPVLHGEINELVEAGEDMGLWAFDEDALARLSDDFAAMEMGGQPDDQDITPETRAMPGAEGMVQFTLPIPALDRQVIYDAIQRAKQLHAIEDSGSALVAVAREFLTRHTQ